jgi:hypothetical protein
MPSLQLANLVLEKLQQPKTHGYLVISHGDSDQ